MRCLEAVGSKPRASVSQIPSSVGIVIPALNASSSLPSVIAAIRRKAPSASIVVVDDGSTDSTAGCLEAGSVHLISHPRNRGKGAALKTGIAHLLDDARIEAVVTMDADGQHDPAELDNFIRVWHDERADLVIGHRSMLGTAMPLHRRMSNSLTSFLVSNRTHKRIPDSQCGYRLLTRRCAGLKPDSDGFEAETEWIIRAALREYRISSVPIRTVYAKERSHMKKWATTLAFTRVLLKEYRWED